MSKTTLTTDISKIKTGGAQVAVGGAIAAVVLLGALHILSPEFNPSWRMVSEYANGHYEWVLALMFACFGFSMLALAYAIRSQLKTRGGKVGLVFLVLAGIGIALTAVFNVNNPLHELVSDVGILFLPIAAMLISTRLGHTHPWVNSRRKLLWAANLTWLSAVLFILTFILMVTTYVQAGGDLNAGPQITELPDGTIALVGWAGRLTVVVFCVWVASVAWQAIKLRKAGDNGRQ